MKESWKTRLLKAVDEDPRSDRAISLATGLGVNTVNELRNTNKSPSIDKVLKVSEELGLSLSYLFWGSEEDKAPISGSKQIEATLKRIEGLDDYSRGIALNIILNAIKARAYEQEHSQPDDQSETANPHREPTP